MNPEEKISTWLSSHSQAESALRDAELLETLRSKHWDFPSRDLVRFVDAVVDKVDELYCSVLTVQVSAEDMGPLPFIFGLEIEPGISYVKAFSVSSGEPLVPEGSWPCIPSNAIEIVRGAYRSDDSHGQEFDELLGRCKPIWSGGKESAHFDNYNLKERRK